MGYTENWGLSLQRIEDYLNAQEDVERLAPLRYRFGTAELLLTSLPPGSMGPFPIERTLVEFRGEGKDTEEIHRRFTLRFLSAGG